MANVTINVDAAVAGRLAVLVAERGTTSEELVGELARTAPQPARRDHAAVTAYIAGHLVPGFGPADVATGEQMWRALATGHLTTLG